MVVGEAVQIIEYEDIGKVSFIRKSATRNIRIMVRPNREVRVYVPRFLSWDSASRFVEEKRSWILKSQMKLSRIEKKLTFFDEASIFTTLDHKLVIGRHNKATIRTAIGGGLIKVCFPEYADIKDPRVQKAIRKAIHQTWKIEAARYLPDILYGLARRHNLFCGNVIVRDNKTRWGSCSRDNNISLNIHLVRLPRHLCEYVILHELAHTVHKHHQKAFWQYLDTLTGGRARILDKELNAYNPQIW